MRPERKWQGLSVVLVGLLAFTVSSPQAVAHTTNNVQHMIEHLTEQVTGVKQVTDTLPAQLAAVDERTARLPDDPASSGDVTAAREQVVAAVGTRGYTRRTVVPPQECREVVTPSPAGMVRLATLTVLTTNTDASALVRVSDPASVYALRTELGHPETFVESAGPGVSVSVCNQTSGAAMLVSAHWDQRPL
jgi:hypothetical protein